MCRCLSVPPSLSSPPQPRGLVTQPHRSREGAGSHPCRPPGPFPLLPFPLPASRPPEPGPASPRVPGGVAAATCSAPWTSGSSPACPVWGPLHSLLPPGPSNPIACRSPCSALSPQRQRPSLLEQPQPPSPAASQREQTAPAPENEWGVFLLLLSPGLSLFLPFSSVLFCNNWTGTCRTPRPVALWCTPPARAARRLARAPRARAAR